MKKIKLMVVLIMVSIMLAGTLAAPAEACACGGPLTAESARSMATYYNSQPYEWRVNSPISSDVPTEYGWALTTDYYMVGMNLCGQTVECFE